MPQNPDRDFSTDGDEPEREQEELRALLGRSEVANLFDRAVLERFGRLIGRAAFDPRKPRW